MKRKRKEEADRVSQRFFKSVVGIPFTPAPSRAQCLSIYPQIKVFAGNFNRFLFESAQYQGSGGGGIDWAIGIEVESFPLGGRRAAFHAVGRSVRYKLGEVIRWMDRPDYASTSEADAGKSA